MLSRATARCQTRAINAATIRYYAACSSRWTGLERGPVNGLLKSFVRVKNRLECERELSRAVQLEVRQALLGFVYAGSVTGRYPPKRDKGPGEFLEPLLSLPKQFAVSAPVDIVSERVNALPNRHVDENAVVFIRPNVGGIAVRGLEPPDKPRAPIRNCVDLVQPRYEPGHLSVI